MRVILFIFLLWYGSLEALQKVHVDGEEVFRLDKRYEFSQNQITSHVLSEDLPLFEIYTVAKSVNFYRMKSSFLVEKFQKQGIKVIPSSAIVEFVRTQQDRVAFLEEKIGPLFVEEYAKYNILVQDVVITPLNHMEIKESHMQDYQFPKKLLKRSNGSFYANFLMADGHVRRVYFRYQVKATLEAIMTTQKLKVGDTVGVSEVNIGRIPFDKVGRELMQKSDIGQYSIRSYTSKDTVLYKNDLMPKIVIRRGDSVHVLINDGSVILSFDGVALQDAAIGKKVRVKNPRTNKSYDAIVIDEKRVEVR